MVTKILRLSPGNIGGLLRFNPRLKLVHLFRNPRSVIHSHLNTEFYHLTEGMTSGVNRDIDALCSRLEKDSSALKQLSKQFPDRVKIVRYEDFVDRDTFLHKVQDLYDFVGFSFPKEEQKSLFSKYYSNESGTQTRSYLNEGFSESPNLHIINYIDKQCESAYASIGYHNFNS